VETGFPSENAINANKARASSVSTETELALSLRRGDAPTHARLLSAAPG
jgi:hypothetical protein